MDIYHTMLAHAIVSARNLHATPDAQADTAGTVGVTNHDQAIWANRYGKDRVLTPSNPGTAQQGLSLGTAALLAGIGLLLMVLAAPFAQLFVFPQLLVPGDAAQTASNLTQNRGLFLAGILTWLVNYAADVLVGWALFYFLAPASRPVSMLAFAFCLIYTAVALGGVFHYVEAFRLLDSPESAAALGTEGLHAQVYLLLNAYQYDWGFALVVFGVVLLLRAWLVVRAEHVPSVFGVLLAVAGFAYIVTELGRYVAPGVNLDFLVVAGLAEPVFMVWLLVKGRRL